ncbi:hypothetical protein JJC00_18950 [Bradyrhizobium diazoefficiens]|uniref:hypothetical protein n=1 Tax=Bradyrhizobium diazoefficiens TaxID=1355477 RepID=UPI00190CCEC0|nr:hypothetical protein [Bradyrhizobium diazoefficiens]QQO30764.1 hypothetical protein JJC00_18950 [Bradyrhizobium diazoefficiens]
MIDPGKLKETYLGDGLYCSFDGQQIKLRAPREDGDHIVYLEPSVQIAFIEFIERIVGRR